jgi:F0F1-type ATP synthase membrane subunit b/b'
MTDRELVAIIRAHRDNSLGGDKGDLGSERATALDHYHGRPYGNEVEGRSQVVSKDLMEAVDWALPAIIRAFVQSGRLGEFAPLGPEDEELAQQESDYLDQVLMRDNPGFMVLHDAVKDTLLLKNGYVKHFWEDQEKVSEEKYTGLTMEQITMMLQKIQSEGAEVEIKGQESYQGEIETFDIQLQVKRKCGKLIWMAVPCEEVRVSKRCRGSLQESPFTEHVTRKTRSDLIEMGMPRSFVDNLPSLEEKKNDEQDYARNSVEEESEYDGQSIVDRSMDEIEFCEAYLRVDYDGDGIAELRKVVTCADRIPPGEQWNEQIPAVPMTGFVMKRVPHRHIGESLDDELSDIQEIKTTLKRQLLDNLYLINNSRTAINELVNPKDLLSSTPGGVVRMKGESPVGNNIMPIPVAPILDKVLPAIDYLDKTKEIRTGIRPGSDMDPDVLKETTKGAFMEHLNRASQKIEMITRMIAESGVKEALLQCHALLVRHQDQPRVVQLRGKWVPVNPQMWKERTDLRIKVGLGTGNEEEKRQKLMLLWQMIGNLGPLGMAGPQQLFNLFSDLAKTMGFDMPEKYVMDPQSPEFQQQQAQKANQPPPEVMIEQMRATAKAQSDQMRAEMQAMVDQNRQEMEAQQQRARMQMELQLERERAAIDMQLERERMKMKADVDALIARMNNAAKLDAAQIQAQTTLSAQQEAASDNAVNDGGAP